MIKNQTREKMHKNILPPSDNSTLNTDPWKIFQIMSEFVEGYQRLSHINNSVSIFGSARTSESNPEYKLAIDIAELLSQNNINIITGGGPGIMEAGNKGASKGKSLSIGLNIQLPFELLNNPHQDIAVNFKFFFSRKSMFIKHSSAIICMPGGFGTLDELFEIATLIQTQKKNPMPIILVGIKYWSGLIDWIKNTMLTEGKISKPDLNIFHLTDDPQTILKIIQDHLKKTSPEKFQF